MKKDEARRRFAEIALRDDNQIRLDEAALLIAAEEYPSLRLDAYISALDEFALDAKLRMSPADDPEACVLQLRDYLFGDLGFSGNQEDYFDARNSFLNDVIDTRTGIPITLSLVFIEVARRLRLRLCGVGMPGHFIVRFDKDNGTALLFDPFNAGRMLTEDDCREMVSGMYGDALAFHPSFLRAVSPRQIVMRMLQNLKGIYSRSGEHSKCLDVVEQGMLLKPDDARNLRDRGMALVGLGRLHEALEDLEEYLRQIPRASDKSEVREKIGDLRQRLAALN
jgi:regulator of sirC expression with transglutaminase-like and TPR domain